MAKVGVIVSASAKAPGKKTPALADPSAEATSGPHGGRGWPLVVVSFTVVAHSGLQVIAPVAS